MQTFSSWISLAENEAARVAVEQVSACVSSRGPRRAVNPLFLHGPAGTGKTHLVSALLADVTGRAPDLQVSLVAAGDLDALLTPAGETEGESEDRKAIRQADLLVVEDLQHLAPRVVEAFAHLVDRGLKREQQLVFTACTGPAQLTHLPARLTSRLGGGLVVGLTPLSPASRLAFLRDRTSRRRLGVEDGVLGWLAEHVSGSARRLDGAVARLEGLTRLLGRSPGALELPEHFPVEAETGEPTVERIAQRVGSYFRVEPRQLQSRGRSRNTLLPRQIGMYLARQLTPLSLQQIGAYFGGRDHSTVLHACRKVEQALARDVHLSGAVRQLHADLA